MRTPLLLALVAAALAAFADQAPLSAAQAVLSAVGEEAGYYPGLEQGVPSFERDRWNQWVKENSEAIGDIQDKAKRIREGSLPAGCIGRDKYTCVATLAQTLAVADYYAISDLFSRHPWT
jgi:hypothetical protein